MRGVIGPFGLLLVVAFIAVTWTLLWRSAGPLAPVTDAELRALGLPIDDRARRLVGRWRDRARRWRTLGGMPVATLVIVVGIVLRQELRVGVGGVPLWSDPLMMGLLGAFAGAIGAEMHHVWRRPSGPRTVSLRPRELAAYLPTRNRARLATVAALAAGSVVFHLVVPASEGVPAPGLLGVAAAGLVAVVHRAIVSRPRPALPETLADADDAVRGLAIRSVEAAGSGAIVLLTLWQLSAVTEVVLGETGVAVVVAGLLYLAGFVLALLWWRSGGPARLLLAPEQPQGVEGAAR